MSTNVCFSGSGAVVEMARGVWRGRPILVNKMIARCLNGQRSCQLTFVFLGRVQSFGAFGVAGQFLSTKTQGVRVSCRVLSCRVFRLYSLPGRVVSSLFSVSCFRVASCHVFLRVEISTSCRVSTFFVSRRVVFLFRVVFFVSCCVLSAFSVVDCFTEPKNKPKNCIKKKKKIMSRSL